MGINEKLNEYKKRNGNSFLLQNGEKTCCRLLDPILERERESYFSLDFPSFEPSVRFGPRSKVVLRGKGYA